MRLPWPFRRPGSDGVAAPAATGVVQRTAAPVRHDWRVAGTLLPTFAGDPGIRVQRFPRDIAGSRLPPPILAPLGHARTADGPAGLVTGLARPTLAPTTTATGGRSDLPLRSRRHAPTPQHLAEGGAHDAPVVPGLARSPATSSTDGDAANPGPARDLRPPLQPRLAPVVAAPSPRPGPLTIARTPDLALAPSRSVAAVPEPGAGRVPGNAAGPGAPALPAASAGAPTRTILRTPGGSRVRLGPPVERSTLGIGGPSMELTLAARPSPAMPPAGTPQGHPAADAPQGLLATPEAPLAGRLATTVEGESLAAARPPAQVPGIPGGLVLARVVASPAAEMDDQHDPDHGTTDRAGVVAPLVGTETIGPAAPLRPTIAAAAADSTGQGGPDIRTRSSGPRGIQRLAAPGGAARPGTPRAATSARVSVARSVAASPSAWLAASSDAGARRSSPLTPDASAGPRASTVGGGPAVDLRLARSVAPVVAIANENRPPGGRPPVDRAPLALAGQRTAAAVAQRAPTDALPATADAPTTQPDPSVMPAPGAGPGTSAPPDQGPAAAAPTIPDRDLDEMVRRLYPRLRRSLSSELLVARERAGTLADLR